MKKTILIVDDSSYMRTMLNEALTAAGFDIIGEAATGEAAIDQALELEPDLITLDNILPDMIGIEVLRFLKGEEKVSSKVVMISAISQESVILEAKELGAYDYIVKPFTESELITTVEKAFN